MLSPFERSLAQFQGYLRLERQCSNHTVAAYTRALKKWADFALQAGKDPLDVNQEDTAAFVKQMMEQGAATTSIAQIVAAMRSWINFRRLEGEGGKLWTPVLPDKPAALPQILTEGELLRLVEACEGDEEALRDRTMITLLAECGLRASEICGLKEGDINWEEGYFTVSGKGKKDRTVPFRPAMAELLEQWIQERNQWVGANRKLPLFLTPAGRAMTRVDLWRMIRARGTKAGIVKARLHPHVLRHTVATHLLRRGMDLRALQELLGHSSIGTTEKYLHFDLELREVYDRCHPHAGEPEEDEGK